MRPHEFFDHTGLLNNGASYPLSGRLFLLGTAQEWTDRQECATNICEAQTLKALNVALHSLRTCPRNRGKTSLRQGELLGILWSDVNWQTGMLTIRQTKTGKFRQVPLNSHVQEILATLQSQSACEPGERIFALDARYLRRAFDRAVKRAGLAPFRFHDLRHTFASRLAMQGCNDRTIMELGGWGSPRMLKRYAHVAPAHLWQAVEGLNGASPGHCRSASTSFDGHIESEEGPRNG